MKKAIKIPVALLLCALLISLIATFASASAAVDPDDYVVDVHDLLSEKDKQAIANAMAAAKEQNDCEFVFLYYSYRRNGYDYMTETQIIRSSPLIDLPKNVMVLEVTKMDDSSDPYTFMVHTFGENTRTSQKELEYIEDLIEGDVKSGKFVEGAEGFVRYGEKAFYGKLVNWGQVFFRAALLSLAISGVTAAVIVYRYKRKLHAAIYPLEQFTKLDLTEKSDVCIGKSVSRVPISSSSSGGGGGSGRSGGGGHSSGSRR